MGRLLMFAPLPLRFALLCGLLAAARIAIPAIAEEAASPEPVEWTDAQVAEHAAQLAGPKTIAVVHFQTADSDEAPCVASWFDRFEKRIAGETLEEFGVREAVVTIDAGSFGVLSTRTVVGMDGDYLRESEAETELRALFAPLGEEVTFQERTIHIASGDSRNADTDRATLNVGCIEKRLAAVGDAPLRLVTVEPRRSEDRESFVSLPELPAEASSGTCLALAFDYRTSTGTLRIVSGDESAIELRIDEESGRAPAFRAFARMARMAVDRVLPAETVATEAALEAKALAEIELPPFGLPASR